MELNGGPKEFFFQLGGWDQRRLHYTECPVFNCGLNRLNSTTDVRCVYRLFLYERSYFLQTPQTALAHLFSPDVVLFSKWNALSFAVRLLRCKLKMEPRAIQLRFSQNQNFIFARIKMSFSVQWSFFRGILKVQNIVGFGVNGIYGENIRNALRK